MRHLESVLQDKGGLQEKGGLKWVLEKRKELCVEVKGLGGRLSADAELFYHDASVLVEIMLDMPGSETTDTVGGSAGAPQQQHSTSRQRSLPAAALVLASVLIPLAMASAAAAAAAAAMAAAAAAAAMAATTRSTKTT